MDAALLLQYLVIAMVVLVSAVRAKIFDGIFRDFRMLLRYMKLRWRRGADNAPPAAQP